MKGVKKVGILGVGVMGGSLSLALKKKFPHLSISGYARSQKSYGKLKRLKILDRVERNLRKVVEDADLIVLALPVGLIVSYFQKITPFLKKGAIVFDLGSSKEVIEKRVIACLPEGVSFVGCHPLSGSEKSGAEFSRDDFYRDGVCLITFQSQSRAAKTVKDIWERLGSKVIFIDSRRHDRILSYLSHLPHLISFSLADGFSKDYLEFVPQSFKDLTRISLSPASVWADIFLSNRKNILCDLNKFIKTLKKFERLIKNKDKAKITGLIKKINTKRKSLP